MIRVGVFFGGFSREREVSFASGRTVYDNLDRTLFLPIPIFVDSLGQWIRLAWQHLYRGSIQDFYPPPALLSTHKKSADYEDLYIESFADEPHFLAQAKAVGEVIHPHEIASHIDFAFIALHGTGGEDGCLQGLLEWYNIPYSGCGIRASSHGIDKAWQKKIFAQAGLKNIPHQLVQKEDWLRHPTKCVQRITEKITGPWVVKPAKEGSSIGVGIAHTKSALQACMTRAFFMENIRVSTWQKLSLAEQKAYVQRLSSLKRGIGMPVIVGMEEVIYHPADLLECLEKAMHTGQETVQIAALLSESTVIVEQHVAGKEFSCIVVEDNTKPIALLPTEILKKEDTYDYKAKYLSGVTRKKTPIDLPYEVAQRIRKACEALYSLLSLEVYARIDGFFTEQGTIYLNDPNTTSGMQLSSLLFHQAAMVGITPPAFLYYLIVQSLHADSKRNKRPYAAIRLLRRLQGARNTPQKAYKKIRVGIITGGETAERHIAIESARNMYEKLASSAKYLVRVFLLSREKAGYACYELPIHLLLQDNALDIEEQVKAPSHLNRLVKEVRAETADIQRQYSTKKPHYESKKVRWEVLSKAIDTALIAMHGRPGEDGVLQKILEKWNIPHNGSRSNQAALMMDKFATNQSLRANGISTTTQQLIRREAYARNKSKCLQHIEEVLSYPMVLKPQDDGCSNGVYRVSDRKALQRGLDRHFCEGHEAGDTLPTTCLLENFVHAKKGEYCTEITVGVLTHHEKGGIRYEVLPPSEVRKAGNMLSLEEKFLTGEGKNITPAIFSGDKEENSTITRAVKETMHKVATVLQIEGYARIDAFVKKKRKAIEVLVVEVNALPGMTAATCIFHQAALARYSPYALIDHIITFGTQRAAHHYAQGLHKAK